MTTKRVFQGLTRRFGFPEQMFDRWAAVEHVDDVFIASPEAQEFDRLKVVRKGIRLARVFAHGIKPTTNAMQVFGRYATRNVLDLDSQQAHRFVQGEELQLEAAVESGFVVVRHDGFAVGVGLYKPGVLKSQVPHSRQTGASGRRGA
jgi:NOL1/NOP2/fmu family ribosome biogenesis protein